MDSEDEEADPEGEYFEIEGEKFTAEELVEFKNSGLRQADYTRKTQEVAEQRKVVAQELEQVQGLNKQYVENLERQAQVLATMMHMDGQTDEVLAQLRNEDFDEYLRVKDQVDQRRQQLQGYFQQIDQAKQQGEQQAEALRVQRIEEAQQQIAQSIPDYMDAEKGPEIRQGVAGMLNEFGFSEEDLNMIDDARMFQVAHALWEARKGEAPEVKKQIAKKKAAKKVSPVIKGGQPKTSSQRRTKKTQDAVSRAVNSGSREDAAAAFEKLLS